MSRYFIKWIVILILWSFVIVLFVINWQSVDDFKKYLSEKRTIESYTGFLSQYQNEAAVTGAQAQSFHQQVDSVDFGLLFLQEDLFWLAKKCDLHGFTFASVPREGVRGPLPLSFQVHGSLTSLVKMLEVLESDYPFISLMNVDTVRVSGGQIMFQVRFNYYFVVTSA